MKNPEYIGVKARALSSKAVETIINARVNPDCVFLYNSTYAANKKTESVALIVETTVLAV
jgi:hypothetical protein